MEVAPGRDKRATPARRGAASKELISSCASGFLEGGRSSSGISVLVKSCYFPVFHREHMSPVASILPASRFNAPPVLALDSDLAPLSNKLAGSNPKTSCVSAILARNCPTCSLPRRLPAKARSLSLAIDLIAYFVIPICQRINE